MTDRPAADRAPQGGGALRWVKIALLVSLVLNVVVVGIYAGQSMKKEERRLRGTDGRIQRIMTMVPEARIAEAQAIFAERRKEVRGLRKKGRGLRDKWVEAIRAEPFSAKALQDAIDASITRSMKRREIIYGGMVDVVSKLTPAERAEFADRLQARMDAWRKRRREMRRKQRESN